MIQIGATEKCGGEGMVSYCSALGKREFVYATLRRVVHGLTSPGGLFASGEKYSRLRQLFFIECPGGLDSQVAKIPPTAHFHANVCALSFAALIMSVHTPSFASQSDEEWCERQWITDSATLLSGIPANGNAMLKQWRSHEARCGTTYAYVGRLAIIQILMKDLSGARATLAKAPKAESPFAYSLDAARIQLDVEERLEGSKPITTSDLVRFETSYVALANKYPNWPTGYALLGGVQTLLGKHNEAISNLRLAAKSDAYELFGVYRNLTISYAATGAYQAAVDAADKAYGLNSGLTSDPAFAISLAKAGIALGQLDNAETVLRLILAKRPEVRNDPEFIRVVEIYKQQRDRPAQR